MVDVFFMPFVEGNEELPLENPWEMIAETVWHVSTWVVQQPTEMMSYHMV